MKKQIPRPSKEKWMDTQPPWLIAVSEKLLEFHFDIYSIIDILWHWK